MPFLFRRGGSRSSADAADMWRSSTHCTPSEVASVASRTSSRQSKSSRTASRTGALVVTMSRPPLPTTCAKDPSPRNKSKKKKKKERISRTTTKPGGSSTKSSAKTNKSSKSTVSPSTVSTDRSRSRTKRDRGSNEQGKEGQTPSRSSTPVRRNRRDDNNNVNNNVHSVERDTQPAASCPPSTPTSSTNIGNNPTSCSPKSTTSTVTSDSSSEDSHGNTTVSSITQTMALDPARMALDYPELAASLGHHPPMIERTLQCPAGAIGCQIDDSSTGPIIDDVLASSSMGGLLFPGDRILAVDGLDVRGLKCGRVTEIMSERRHQERMIKVLSIVNIAENGGKGNTGEQPKEGESGTRRNPGMERLRARKKKINALAVSRVPAIPTPKSKSSPIKDDQSQPQPLHRRLIVAPAGKLGLVLKNTKNGPAIHTIKPTSPLEGKIFVGDQIVRVDGTDTTTMKAKELTKLMAGNSTKTREVVVLSMMDLDGATDEKPEQELQIKSIQPSPSPPPKPLTTEINKPSHAAASITSATASLSTRSGSKDCGVTESETAEQPSVSVDHSLPPFRSTPSRRKEGESFQQYVVRRRRDLSEIRAKKECQDDPACTDVKSRSSEGNRSSVPSFSTIKTSAEKFVQEGKQDAAIHQYERLISCLEMRYCGSSNVERDGHELTRVEQAGAQEEIIVLCDALRELYRAKREKAKSVKCLRKKISTQRSLLKLKTEMM